MGCPTIFAEVNVPIIRSFNRGAIVPESFKDLFVKVAFTHLATIMADGSPLVTPVWCRFDGTSVWVNWAKGRLKDKNMRRNKQVALSIQDPDNAYRYPAIQGVVTEITESGADAHIMPWRKNTSAKIVIPIARRANYG